MPWWGILLTALAVVVLLGMLGSGLQKLFPRRTIGNWRGSGVNTELWPAEAAVLLGRAPGTILSIVLLGMEAAGRVRVTGTAPVSVERGEGGRAGPYDAAFLAALGPDGEIGVEGALRLVEAVYDGTNGKMRPFSGRRTAMYYQHLVDRFWEEAIERGLWAPEAFGWLLLRDPHEVWDEIGRTPEEKRLKESFRVQGHCIQDVLTPAVCDAAMQSRKGGFWTHFRTPGSDAPGADSDPDARIRPW